MCKKGDNREMIMKDEMDFFVLVRLCFAVFFYDDRQPDGTDGREEASIASSWSLDREVKHETFVDYTWYFRRPLKRVWILLLASESWKILGRNKTKPSSLVTLSCYFKSFFQAYCSSTLLGVFFPSHAQWVCLLIEERDISTTQHNTAQHSHSHIIKW